MNYELLKELKDAGFPLKEVTKADYQQPTLEELIEACGDDFRTLIKRRDSFGGGFESFDWEGICGIGETSSEAVANLWLKLNKKDDN